MNRFHKATTAPVHRYRMPLRQRGVVLVMSLVFLVLLTILGITTLNMTSLEEKMAGNTKDRNLAFQATESALLAGENTVGSAIMVNAVVASVTITNDGLHKPSTTSTPIWDESTGVWSGSDY
ncbi:MAG: PilX N-terminal domain-containing pilus assembly protein, partial [Sulfuricaulis sp.]|nr:PilX N-terminal domain-containing pilus assembly protein [Sulfuricaulis sp.]